MHTKENVGTHLNKALEAIENLWSKYAVTAKAIEAERDKLSEKLHAFMVK